MSRVSFMTSAIFEGQHNGTCMGLELTQVLTITHILMEVHINQPIWEGGDIPASPRPSGRRCGLWAL